MDKLWTICVNITNLYTVFFGFLLFFYWTFILVYSEYSAYVKASLLLFRAELAPNLPVYRQIDRHVWHRRQEKQLQESRWFARVIWRIEGVAEGLSNSLLWKFTFREAVPVGGGLLLRRAPREWYLANSLRFASRASGKNWKSGSKDFGYRRFASSPWRGGLMEIRRIDDDGRRGFRSPESHHPIGPKDR